MQTQVLLRSILLFLATVCFAMTLQPVENTNEQNREKRVISDEHARFRRAVRKAGFFRTLFSVLYEQYTDTKDTLNTVNKLVNDNFLDESVARTSTTPPPNPDPNVTTTAMPYKITRTELNRILRRNLLGLVRLYNIELRDALGQSDKTNAEFRRNASKEVSKYL